MALSFTNPITNKVYDKYIWQSPVKTDRWNDTDILEFALVPFDASFVKLVRGDYIQLTSTKYGTWFTGWITGEPEYEYVGKLPTTGAKVWGYKYTASSDDYLLTLKQLGPVPTYINTTQGQILTDLANRVAPGAFDTTGIQDGLTVARYEVDPKKKFHDVVKEFATAANYRFSAKSKKLYYIAIDPNASPLTIDFNDKFFTPQNLSISPTKDQVVNDAIIIGEDEAQGWANEWYLGDGYTAKYPLFKVPYGVEGRTLIDETFSSLDTTKWIVNDTNGQYLAVDSGFLNVVGGNGNSTLNVSTVSKTVIPLEGLVRHTHGEYQFVNVGTLNALQGVICGLWTATPSMTNVSTFPGCLYGIRVFRGSDGSCQLRPVVNSNVDVNTYLFVDYSKRYVFRTVMFVNRNVRLTNQYSARKADGSVQRYGGASYGDTAVFNTVITEIDPLTANVTNQWRWVSSMALTSNITVAQYAPVASNDLHCALSNITISQPMLVGLEVDAWDTATSQYKGYQTKHVGPNEIDSMDGYAPAATVEVAGSKDKGSSASLQFFANNSTLVTNVPAPRDKVHVWYRKSGPAVARVQNRTVVGSEASKWGDNGLRSLVKSDIQPAPRTSSECESAAACTLLDYGYQHYEGTYRLPSNVCFTSEPLAGSILKFGNVPTTFPDLSTELIVEVKTTFEANKVAPTNEELFTHEIRFGRNSALTRLVAQWNQTIKQDNASTKSTDIPDWIDLSTVGSAYLEDMLVPKLTNWDATKLYFDMGSVPSGGYEVRYTDAGWGADDGNNLLLRTALQTFSVSRDARSKYFFVKAYDARNKFLYSEDCSQSAYSKTATLTRESGNGPDGEMMVLNKLSFAAGQWIYQQPGLPGNTLYDNKTVTFTVSVKGEAGKQVKLQIENNTATTSYAQSVVTCTGGWQRLSLTAALPTVGRPIVCVLWNASNGLHTVYTTRWNFEVASAETSYCMTNSTPYGVLSRYPAICHVAFPFVPPPPTATISVVDPKNPVVTINLPSVQTDVWGVEIRAADNTTVLWKKDLIDAGMTLQYVKANNTARSLTFYCYTYNLLGEYSTAAPVSVDMGTAVVTSLGIDGNARNLFWTSSYGMLPPMKYRVEVFSDSGLTNKLTTVEQPVTWLPLSDDNFFNHRYFRVTPVDVLGDGTPLTGAGTVTVPVGVTYTGTYLATVSGVNYSITPANVPIDVHHFEAVWVKDGSTPDANTKPMLSPMYPLNTKVSFFVGGVPGETVKAYIRAVSSSGGQQPWVQLGSGIAVSAIPQSGSLNAADIKYANGTSVEALKPAAAGADVTAQNTAANTSYVSSTPASTVAQVIGSAAQIDIYGSGGRHYSIRVN